MFEDLPEYSRDEAVLAITMLYYSYGCVKMHSGKFEHLNGTIVYHHNVIAIKNKFIEYKFEIELHPYHYVIDIYTYFLESLVIKSRRNIKRKKLFNVLDFLHAFLTKSGFKQHDK